MKRSTRLVFSVATLFLTICFQQPVEAKVEKGQKFPEIALPALEAKKKFDVKSLKGKVVLVDFWASWCEPCKISMPFLNSLAKKYKGKVEVIGINVDEAKKDAEGFLKDHPAPSVKFVSDAKQEFIKKVDVTTMPSSFILDKSGTVVLRHEGFREDDKKDIEAEIKKLLKK